jgi:hypothetical protein
MAQVVQCLLIKCEALSSRPSTEKKKKSLRAPHNYYMLIMKKKKAAREIKG